MLHGVTFRGLLLSVLEWPTVCVNVLLSTPDCLSGAISIQPNEAFEDRCKVTALELCPNPKNHHLYKWF